MGRIIDRQNNRKTDRWIDTIEKEKIVILFDR